MDRTRLVIGRDPSRAEILSVLVKRSYRLNPAKGLVDQIETAPWVTKPVLRHFDDRIGTELVHDFELFPWKASTDLIVRGPIVTPGHRRLRSMVARVVVGHARKDVEVIGNRWLERGRFTTPERFVTMPLEWSRAYGGVDTSVVRPKPRGALGDTSPIVCVEEHPGVYPRNPIGRGWAVQLQPHTLLALPNFEDPRRRLTPESIAVGDPRRWSWAPEPRGFGWTDRTWYPRCAFLGLLPVFPPADEDPTLPEVASGWMPKGLSRWLRELGPGMPVHPRFNNGASSGMRVLDLAGNEPVTLDGFFGRGPVRFDLPGHRPRVNVTIRGERLSTEVVAHTLEIEPAEKRVTLIWAGRARTGSQLRTRLVGVGIERDVFEAVVVEVDGRVVELEAEPCP